MSILDIKKYPSAVLRRKSKSVGEITPLERKLLDDMAETMYHSNGVGLAAPQVGINRALIVVDVGDRLIKLINPSIIKAHGKDAIDEGCLSFPNISIKIPRAETVSVKAQDENGNPIQIKTNGLLAKVLQHEIDHLKGILIIDYASIWSKICLRKKLKKINPKKSS